MPMCEHIPLHDAKGNTIVVDMFTLAKPDDVISFPARICERCRSIFVPTTVSKSFELKGHSEGHLTR